ncbi:MAG: 50S ribosomal protein L6 [bacterium]
MSRIGKKPILIPDKVKVRLEGRNVLVDGPLGSLPFTLPEGILVDIKDGTLTVTPASGSNPGPAMHGTVRARLHNMVHGVTNGYSKVLEIQGVGFRGQTDGKKLTLQLGLSHPVLLDVPAGVKMAFDAKATVLTISGVSKELVGDTAARIRRKKLPEPYKGTGIRYQGEHIVRKAGKTAAGAGSGGEGGGKK